MDVKTYRRMVFGPFWLRVHWRSYMIWLLSLLSCLCVCVCVGGGGGWLCVCACVLYLISIHEIEVQFLFLNDTIMKMNRKT